MVNKVIFSPTGVNANNSLYNTPPVKALSVLPDWYKDLAGYRHGSSHSKSFLHPVNDRGQDGSDVSTKLCNPLMDAMTSGYIQTLPEDVEVVLDKDEKPSLFWKTEVPLIDTRPLVDFAIPKECHPIHFGWKMFWYYETPPGYSLLITHPFNRYDLPFYSPFGIVDSDIWGLPVFFSFFLKRGFEGVIEKGTPLFQMIPIKREDWSLELDYSEEKHWENKIKEEKRRSHITAHYKKSTWQRKNY
jgi:hypothetical protein